MAYPLASSLFVVRPASFSFNPETEATNKFQQALSKSDGDTQQQALVEFDRFVQILKAHDIHVACLSDTLHPHTPDSIFPNNWISFHPGGRVVLYPMQARNRQLETQKGFLRGLVDGYGINIAILLDLRLYAEQGQYLEGTGSMVMDHKYRQAWVCLSERSFLEPLKEACRFLEYEPIIFEAFDTEGFAIYHTNVMMSIGEDYALICEEAIAEGDRNRVMQQLLVQRHTVISIDQRQMAAYSGNIIQVRNAAGEKKLLMSESAYQALNPDQRELLSAQSTLVPIPIPTIETVGGGSIRCMVAELF